MSYSTTLRARFEPLDLFRIATAAKGIERECGWFWASPAGGPTLAGLEAALEIHPGGEDRFGVSRNWLAELQGSAILIREDDRSPSPTAQAFAGFGFQADERMDEAWGRFRDTVTLPKYLLSRHGDAHLLTVNAVVHGDDADEAHQVVRSADEVLQRLSVISQVPAGPGPLGILDRKEVPHRREWEDTVRSLVDRIATGELDKVVLARRLDLDLTAEPDIGTLLTSLRDRYPEAAICAYTRGGRSFVCASPERLVSLSGCYVEAPCLAGSAPRGGSEKLDEESAAGLLASDKNRGEHEAVVGFVRERLMPVLRSVSVEDTRLLSLRNVHHLFTPVHGTAHAGVHILDLVERLHPTPAVCGVPQAAAKRAIEESEPFARGWFSGPIGWISATGDGDFFVGLRSGLVEGGHAHLFAGCGIVVGSEADDEWQESNLKFEPLLQSLTDTV